MALGRSAFQAAGEAVSTAIRKATGQPNTAAEADAKAKKSKPFAYSGSGDAERKKEIEKQTDK